MHTNVFFNDNLQGSWQHVSKQALINQHGHIYDSSMYA